MLEVVVVKKSPFMLTFSRFKLFAGRLVLFASLLTFAACQEILNPWTYENPVDPGASNFEGVTTVANANDINPAELGGTGPTLFPPTLVAQKVTGAQAYRFQIAKDRSFSVALAEGESASNSWVPTGWQELDRSATWYWRCAAKVGGTWGGWSANLATFSLSTPLLGTTVPVDGAVISDTTPDFDWDDVPGASGYRIQISTSADFATTIADVNTLTASQYSCLTVLANGVQFWWRTSAKNADGVWSAWSTAYSCSSRLPVVILKSPTDLAISTDATPVFDWDDVSSAAVYHIQISASESFVSTVLDENSIVDSHYMSTVALVNHTQYWWRIAYKNSDGVWSEMSGPRSFYVFTESISILNPADGAIHLTSLIISWSAIPDITDYELQTASSVVGLDSAVPTAVSANSITIDTSGTLGNLYWRVRPVSVNGLRGAWSSVRRVACMGGTGPAGGLVFYDAGTAQSWGRFLECAPFDQSSAIKWNNGSHLNVEGAKGSIIGTGKSNTAAIAIAQGPGNYAAKICIDLILGGCNDWFLPSKDELQLLHANLVTKNLGGFSVGNCNYWTSTQQNTTDAYVLAQMYGSSNYTNNTNDSIFVRAIRAFE